MPTDIHYGALWEGRHNDAIIRVAVTSTNWERSVSILEFR